MTGSISPTAFWFGQVVNATDDPHRSGRVQVRIDGHHGDSRDIPDADLPWAAIMLPTTNAAWGRMGTAPVGLVVGSRVVGWWADLSHQTPLVFGALPKAGDSVSGSTTAGAPTINPAAGGSTPAAAYGNPNNTRSAVGGAPSIADINSGQSNVTSVPVTSGVNACMVTRDKLRYSNFPTTASADKSNKDILSVLFSTDPLSLNSALPCFNININIVKTIMSILGSLKNMIINAIKNALLSLAAKLGLFKVLAMLNQAVSAAKNIQSLIAALNIKICGVNLINQSLFDGVDFIMASVINDLNTVASTITGSVNAITDAALTSLNNLGDSALAGVNDLLSSVATAPAASVATDTSPRPPTDSIVESGPIQPGFVQQYSKDDPYPGYIIYRNASTGETIYTPRNGQPNYTSAQDHIQFATQDHFTTNIATSLINGNLNLVTLTSTVTASLGFGQVTALTSVLGPGVAGAVGAAAGGAIGVAAVATLLPKLAVVLNTAFNANIPASLILPTSTFVPVASFIESQLMTAQQKIFHLVATS
jgi:hypothetical protein